MSASLRLVSPEEGSDVAAWEAQFVTDLAATLTQYLADRPAPPSSRLAANAETWAANLRTSGRARMEGARSQPALTTGEAVMREVAELIASRLPEIPIADPDRGVLLALVHAAPPSR